MFKRRGFDSQRYIASQTAAVKVRIKKFQRTYLEFGGKLCYDFHASRVLPGYNPKNKVKIIRELGDHTIVYCINAKDLDSNKLVGRAKRTYEEQVLKDLKDLKKFKLNNEFIVITRFRNEKKAKQFSNVLRNLGKKVYFHYETNGYSSNPEHAIEGYKKQGYVPINNKLVIITGPAGNSGKMSFAMSQIFHEQNMGENSGFAKFETFPVHNLGINHPINLAYEAATADLQDKNMLDPYHKENYGINATNYNRDINNYEILRQIMKKTRKVKYPFGYKSPTDMGINNIYDGIINEEVCIRASIKEIKERYEYYLNEKDNGRETIETIKRMKEILKKIKK